MKQWLAVIAVVLALMLAACGGDEGDENGGTSRPEDTAEATETPQETEDTGDGGEEPDATLSPEEEAELEALLDDVDTAIQVLDAFWEAHWSENFTGTYVSPTINEGYVGSDNPTCGGESIDGAGNAYYCQPDDYIDWDWELFVAHYGDEVVGDAFVYFVLAHEWGHAIQARLDESLTTVDAELQADCLGAAALNGAAADEILIFEAGDRGEIFQSLGIVADEVEWGDTGDHGSADQRIEAYQLGESGGVEVCLPE